MESVDVIIVGAGVAGLTAAYRLLKVNPECQLLVLEAKDRIGGRIQSVEMQGANGKDRWDLGGQWVGGTQHHILWLLKELDIEIYKQYSEGASIVQIGGTKVRKLDSLVPFFNIFELLDLQKITRKIELDVAKIDEIDPRTAKNANRLDGVTVEQYIKGTAWTEGGYELMEAIMTSTFGIDLREISCLSVFHNIATGESLNATMETKKGGAQEFKIKGAAQTIPEKLLEKLGNEKIILDSPVASIDQSNGDVITVTTLPGKKYTAKCAIVATPVQHSVKITYMPTLPYARIDLAGNLICGNLTKFLVTYKSAFWREKGFSGEVISNGGTKVISECDTGPIQAVLEATSFDENPALVGFYASASQWMQVDVGKRKAAVLDALVEFLGPEARDILDFKEKDWALDPYTGGCPGSLLRSVLLTHHYEAYTTPHDRVHWAGTESATHWNGYISGAVQSGMKVADEVTDRLYPNKEGDNLLQELDAKMIRQRSKDTKRCKVM